MQLRGRTWKFGHDLNTDVMYPTICFTLPEKERAKHCMEAIRPGWSSLVRAGDILIGGRNFGYGSSRPGAASLLQLGICCVIADGVTSLFLRNSINYAMPVVTCPGVHDAFTEGDEAEVDVETGVVNNVTRGSRIEGERLPGQLVEIIRAGGLLNVLLGRGLVRRAT
jgi:3-isopropylmalate/(R)-2-methylmalate dehydratase small subunit